MNDKPIRGKYTKQSEEELSQQMYSLVDQTQQGLHETPVERDLRKRDESEKKESATRLQSS